MSTLSGLWNNFIFGGSSSGGAAGVPLSTLLDPMLRIAGITMKPGITPSVDQYAEIIPMVNRMLSSYNLDGHNIYTAEINEHDMVSGKKIYTIGPGGELDQARPLYIKEANIIFPTTPQVRRQVYIMNDDEWADISVQDIPGAPSIALYYDGGYDSDGLARLYVYYQPPSGYKLELYTWLALKSDFTATTDVALFPPGYEEMIVWNGAIRCASMYPHDSNLSPDARGMAARALRAVQISNSDSPKQDVEPGFHGGPYYEPYGWTDGPFRGH